jgi:hypothetical protein
MQLDAQVLELRSLWRAAFRLLRFVAAVLHIRLKIIVANADSTAAGSDAVAGQCAFLHELVHG